MDNRALVEQFFDVVYNQHDTRFIHQYFAPDYHEHTDTGARSNSDCERIILGSFEVFPDLRVEVHDVLVDGELAASRQSFTGTHRGEFLGMPPSGTQIHFEAMEFFRIRNGNIVESWGAWPLHDIIQQIRDAPNAA